MPTLVETAPLARTTVDAIFARLTADVVAGQDPAALTYPDLAPGSILSDTLGAAALEFARLYDEIRVEYLNAAMPATTYGLWLDAWALVLGLERKDETFAEGVERFTGAAGTTLAAGARVSTESLGDATGIVFEVTAGGAIPAAGFVDLPIRAVEAGAAGNVPANAVVVPVSAMPVATALNPASLRGGTDVEADDALRDRVIRRLSRPRGPGNRHDYEDWALEEPGVGYARAEPNWAGLGTVRVVVTDPSNRPTSSAAVASLQTRLDPTGGDGDGQAPPGAVVTVITADEVVVAVSVQVQTDPGYALTATATDRGVSDAVTAAIRGYIVGLGPGADVVESKLIGAIVAVPGVADALVTAPAATVAVEASQVATPGNIAITVAA